MTDAKEAFRDAKAIGKTEPTVVFTDGLPSYSPAMQGVFPNAIHVSNVGIRGRVNNNRMERYHGTFKERNKVMRGLKKTDSAFIDGQRIYYNHIRPHTALGGRTPAEVAGIRLDLDQNKWESLIKKASVAKE